MRVYYFTSAEYGLQNIEYSRLKVSDFNNVNDPFELLGIELSDKSVRSALKREKSQISKSTGFICFSEDWQNPVQWGHYAENHKGICLGFDVSDENLKKIKYVKKRLNTSNFYANDKKEKLLTTKFSHWSYEKEHRIIVDLSSRTPDDRGLFFEPFSQHMKLREVIIGCESSVTQSAVRDLCENKDKKIKIFNARAAFRDFKIVWDRSKKSTRA
ncbi:DUF2971 domain-containing protein [Vibrio nigripulchritudo]|uniref:DUF2971 domain-containing protein n=1 Tax=Vibrio nigripulchritudo TaxID=28173 RepID=UPI0003B19B3E|nr:DUF2971 domain-containing protein [Vibrio nigripulchritudo]CCN72688.1 conserved hypothetical protein [Vibrio nigripulchritudo SFn118]